MKASVQACLCIAAIGAVLLAACKTLPGPVETTPDGLERVPSRSQVGVYRAPGAPFEQYKRISVEPLTVTFVKDWEENHKDVADAEIRRMRAEAAAIYRDELERELISKGTYQVSDTAAPDVLRIDARVVDLDVPAPESADYSKRSYAPRSVALEITGELRDSVSGELVGRIILFAGGERYGLNELRIANRSTNAHEIRNAFSQWSRALNEALAVAKVERPRPRPPAPPEQ